MTACSPHPNIPAAGKEYSSSNLSHSYRKPISMERNGVFLCDLQRQKQCWHIVNVN